jgi:hypothetical protein
VCGGGGRAGVVSPPAYVRKASRQRANATLSGREREQRELRVRCSVMLGRTHSITLSARRRSAGGIVRPRALAVFMLIHSSNAVGCSIGSSLGFVPLRILST